MSFAVKVGEGVCFFSGGVLAVAFFHVALHLSLCG